MSQVTTDTERVVREYLTVWNDRAYEKIPEVVAESFVMYDPWAIADDVPGPRGEVHGRDGLEPFVRGVVAGFPDFHVEVLDLFCEGETAMYTGRIGLTHEADFCWIPPTGRHCEFRYMGVIRVVDGRVDVVATDHAPHTRAEKEATLLAAPSGVPGVETMVPLLLAETRDGPLTVERVRDLTAATPAETFDLNRKGRIEAGRDADLALYDLDRPRDIDGTRLHSKCGWTPFEGRQGVFPTWTLVRGERAYDGAMDTFGVDDGENVRYRNHRKSS